MIRNKQHIGVLGCGPSCIGSAVLHALEARGHSVEFITKDDLIENVESIKQKLIIIGQPEEAIVANHLKLANERSILINRLQIPFHYENRRERRAKERKNKKR